MSTGGGRTDVAALRRELLRRRLAEANLAESGPAADSAGPAERSGRALSPGQQRMWSLQQLDPLSVGYNICIALDLTGSLDLDRLVTAAHAVVDRHDILRTTYAMAEDGRVEQIVHPVLAPAVQTHDLTGAVDAATRTDVLARALLSRPFDLSADSPLRMALIRTGPSAVTLVVVAHHIAWDDGTSAVFFGELTALYRDPAVTLPPAPQFADVAHRAATDSAPGLEYWRRVLEPLPDLLDLPLPAGRTRVGGGHDQARRMRPGAGAGVRELARRDGASTFIVLLAAVGTLLHRYTGSTDFLVGAPVVNRDVPGGASVIGYLGNTIALRTVVEPTDTFRTLLARVKQTCFDGYAHQDVELDDVAREADPRRSRGDAGLFNVVLSMRAPVLEPFRAAGLTATRRHVPGHDARFDLTIAVETDGDDLTVEANHPAGPGAQELIAQFLGHLDRVLATVLADPDRPLADLDLLTEQQRRQLLRDWNDTTTAAETRPLPALFAAQVARTPNALAVLAEGTRVGYRQLGERVNRLARHLAAAGIGPESTVALSVPRSVEMVVAILAVATAGAAYVPVDPDYPVDRVRLMLSDSCPALLLTTAGTVDRLPDCPGLRTVVIDDPATAELLSGYPASALTGDERVVALHPEHPAYVIYTSGSTGAPKGVVVSHRALSNHLGWALRRFTGLRGHTLMHSSVSFDFSVTPLLGTLVAGGVLELCADSPDAIADAVGAATFVKITPGHLPLLPSVRFAERGPRTLVIAGEALHGEALAGWVPPVDGRIDVINEYGPTETTVGCLLHDVEGAAAGDVVAGAVPVGSPVDNTVCHVLDARLTPVPVGVVGELYVGGTQLARGYLNRRGRTATRFVADPLGPPGGRLYRTGDRVRRLASGAMEFLGRVDEQVKIRGFRVEPGEIESVLSGHAGVAQAVVAARTDGPGGTYLAAYVVPDPTAAVDPAKLRAHVAASLPEYMVPAVVLELAALPLSPSGKVDRRALPAPEFAAGEPAATREPVGDVERRLAALFADVLGRESVGVDESFFELGGDSIVSIRLVSRARKAGLRFSPRDVFTHRTVARLAGVTTVEPARPAEPADDPDGVGRVELTPIMRSFADRGPLGDSHRMSLLVDGPPGADLGRLGRVVQALLDRHDALRAMVIRAAGLPVLEVRPAGSVTAGSVLRRAALPVDAAEADAAVAAELDAATARLAPASGVVLQLVWFDAGPQRRGRLLAVAHHLVVDGVSWRILVDDLCAAWREVAQDRAPALPPVRTAFRTWAHGLTEAAAGRAGELATWRAQLAGPEAPLGTRLPDPHQDMWSTVRTVTVDLDSADTEAVLGSVPAMFFAGVDDVLLTALGLAVAAESRGAARSTAVLLEGHGRREAAVPGADLSRTVGWFTSQHPVRLDVTGIDLDDAFAGGPAAGAAVKRTKELLRGLPDHGIGFGMLRHLHADTAVELAGLPAPQLGFNYLGRFDDAGYGDWTIRPGGLEAAYAPDMAMPAGLVVNAVTEPTARGPRLRAHWMYAEGAFERAAVTALAERWRAALRGVIRHAAGPGAGGHTPSDLSLVSLDQGRLDALEAKWGRA